MDVLHASAINGKGAMPPKGGRVDLSDADIQAAVVYMVKHTPKTAYGIVVNKPYGKGKIADLMEGLGLGQSEATRELPLHYGGPVAYKHAFFLHSSEYDHARGEYINGAITFTKDASILQKYAAGEGPKRLFVALGYAGWSGGQLEGEVERATGPQHADGHQHDGIGCFSGTGARWKGMPARTPNAAPAASITWSIVCRSARWPISPHACCRSWPRTRYQSASPRVWMIPGDRHRRFSAMYTEPGMATRCSTAR